MWLSELCDVHIIPIILPEKRFEAQVEHPSTNSGTQIASDFVQRVGAAGDVLHKLLVTLVPSIPILPQASIF